MAVKCVESEITERYAAYCGDCCEVMDSIPDDSIGFSVFSPPFADLYCYSNSERDMGNCRNYGEFFSTSESWPANFTRPRCRAGSSRFIAWTFLL